VRRILTNAAETWTTTAMKEDKSIFEKKILAKCMVQYATEGSGGRDTIEN